MSKESTWENLSLCLIVRTGACFSRKLWRREAAGTVSHDGRIKNRGNQSSHPCWCCRDNWVFPMLGGHSIVYKCKPARWPLKRASCLGLMKRLICWGKEWECTSSELEYALLHLDKYTGPEIWVCMRRGGKVVCPRNIKHETLHRRTSTQNKCLSWLRAPVATNWTVSGMS